MIFSQPDSTHYFYNKINGCEKNVLTECGYSFYNKELDEARVAQLVEHQPSKLRVAGSNPVSRSRYLLLFIPLVAGWSSQVARRAHNPKVEGSNPSPATKNISDLQVI